MKRILTSLVLITLLGCQGHPQNNINLEEINNDFLPKQFMKPFENKKDILNKESKMLFDKIFTQKKASKQDTIRYQAVEFELSKINRYKIDSLYHVIDEEKVWSDENKKKWAISYNMMSFSSIDTLAYFKDIYFPKVSFIENLNGKFIALSATTSYNKPTYKDFEKLYRLLTKKFGKPKKNKIRAFARDKYSFEWESNLLVYNMISDTDEYSFKKSNHNLRLYVINKDYSNFIKGKIGVGDWIELK